MSDFDPRLVRRFQTGKGLESRDALDELVRNGHAKNPELVAAVEERIRSGEHVLESTLVRWIIAAAPTSTDVFNTSWTSLKQNRDAVLDLYKARVVAPRQIEERVLHLLDEIGVSPGEPFRPYFIDAIRDHGSDRCVAWLKSLLVDLQAEHGLRRDLAVAIPDVEKRLVAAALGEAASKCAEAIAAIEARRLAAGQLEDEGSAVSGFAARPSRYAAIHLAEARQAAASSSPGACLNPLRMYAEALCNDLYVRWKLGNKPPDLLGDKLNALRETLKSKDRWLQARLWGLKQLVDFGSHHTPAFVDHVTAVEVRPILELAEGVHRTYLNLD